MKLHCLGTAGYHPSESRHTSCYFLPESGIVLDAGSGMFRLPKLIETDYLDILLTHSHLDHVLGLTFLLGILYQRPVDQLRIWGDPAKLAAIQTHLFSDELFPVKLAAQWMPVIAGEPFELQCKAKVTGFALEHPGGAIGYRIDWPTGSMAYVSDTTADSEAAYVKRVQGVDLLLHECNFRSDQDRWAVKTGHSTTDQVGRLAAKVAAAQTWLVHVNPMETDNDPVGIADAQVYLPNIAVADDNQVIEF